MRHLKYLIILLLLSSLTFFRMIQSGNFTFHDETQFANLHQYFRALDAGQFPPRWAPDMEYTYGSPLPQFNYQLPYYLGYIIHKAGFNFIATYKILLALTLVASALGMYLLLSVFVSPILSLMGACLYLFAPYHATDVWVRGTLGEAMAFSVLPFVAYYFHQMASHKNFRYILYFSLSLAILVLTHQPTTVIFTPLLAVMVLSYVIINKDFSILFRTVLSGIISICLSAFYLFPVLLEMKFIKGSSPFNFYDHFPFIYQLIKPFWGYGASIEGPYDGMSFNIGLPLVTTFLIGVLLLFFKRHTTSSQKGPRPLVTTSLFSLPIYLFLINIRSTPIWNLTHLADQIQFPWRLLIIITFILSFSAPLMLVKFSTRLQNYLSIIVIGCCLLFLAPNFRPGEVIQVNDNYYFHRFLPNIVLNPGEKISKDYLNHSEDYVPLPLHATRPKTLPDSRFTSRYQFTSFSDVQGNFLKYSTTSKTVRDDKITVNQFYFPGWKVTVDGQMVKLYLDQQGAMVFDITSGTHQIQVSYHRTLVRFLSDKLSLFAWLFLLSYFVYIYINSHHTHVKRR